jgi:hypothetical protein
LRQRQRDDRHGLMIPHLRRLAYLATVERADAVAVNERCMWARLIECCDAALRILCNPSERRV